MTAPINAQRAAAYREAQKIDKRINNLLIMYPLKDNGTFWRVFVRTLRSSLDILNNIEFYSNERMADTRD